MGKNWKWGESWRISFSNRTVRRVWNKMILLRKGIEAGRDTVLYCTLLYCTVLYCTLSGFTLYATSENSGDILASIVIRDGQDSYLLHALVRQPVQR
jgi:hypothetical protein